MESNTDANKPNFEAEDIPNFTVGKSQEVDLQPGGGTPPYTCDVTQGDLPAGLTFSAEGTLSGVATKANDDNPPTVFFRVTDSRGAAGTTAYEVTVVAASSAKA